VDSETELVQSFIGLSGEISNRKGTDIHVTFSIYLSLHYINGEPDSTSAEGLCRASDDVGILAELFSVGTPVFLSSSEFEATILLTSPGSFQVVGSISRK
jgi:hypothetical protein